MSGPVAMADVYGRINRAIAAAGGQAAFARRLGVTPQYINLVINGHRPPSNAMLAQVGLRRVERIEVAA